MSRPMIGVALPPAMHDLVADALATWGRLERVDDRAGAVATLQRQPARVVVLAAATLEDLTAAEQIRAAHRDTLVCLLAATGMTDRLAVHCLHAHRAQLIMGPPLRADRLRDLLRPLLPAPTAVPAETPFVDPNEELELARAVAEEAALESARMRAALTRHKRAAEAAHKDLATTRKQAAESRRRAQRAEAQRDAAVTERDHLAIDVTALRDEASAARLDAGRLAQELASLEATQEQTEAEAEWSARASDAANARIAELQAAVEAAQAEAAQVVREREAARIAAQGARAEAAALRAAGPGRTESLKEQLGKSRAEAGRLQEALDRDRADAHELRVALTRQQHELMVLDSEARRLRATVEEHDERAVVLVEGLRRAEVEARGATAAKEAAEADAADARAQQLHDITWFMEELRRRRP
jgi:hypothetical protein